MTDKQKLLEYLHYKGITKNKFYIQTGLSVGFLDSGKSLGVEKLRNILDIYHDLNPAWFVPGDGPMLKIGNELRDIQEPYTRSIGTVDLMKRIEELSVQIGVQVNENKHLQETIRKLLAEVEELKKRSFGDTLHGKEVK